MQNKYLFKNTKSFYTFVKSVVPKFDSNKSHFTTMFGFFDMDGGFYNCRNFNIMLTQLNKLAGEEIFNTAKSRATSASQYIVVTGINEVAEKEACVIESNISAAVIDVVSDVADELLAEPEQLISLEVDTEDTSTLEVDWKWIETLEDTSEDKLSLDKYAEDNFGIKLKRNMKLENMIAKFKKALEV